MRKHKLGRPKGSKNKKEDFVYKPDEKLVSFRMELPNATTVYFTTTFYDLFSNFFKQKEGK